MPYMYLNNEGDTAMKLHEVKTKVQEVTGLMVMDGDKAVEVLVTGDQPEMVPVVRRKLEASGLPFSQSKHRKFKGAKFTVHLRNVGTAFAADWEFA